MTFWMFFLAIATYLTNTWFKRKEAKIQNVIRFSEFHRKIFSADSFPILNYEDLDNGTYVRDFSDKEMEKKFFNFLGDCEHISFLKEASGITHEMNAYMMGWFCQKILPHLTEDERKTFFWSKAVKYIEETSEKSFNLSEKS
ncbi:hypothetical protein AB834_00135 [PVC group bacterium (ex Bugula neritina AB1)]|nr:hypothetical protein AB834_00135 [PVC group bacterium (ex Bugula neritina AB1)]